MKYKYRSKHFEDLPITIKNILLIIIKTSIFQIRFSW